MARSQSQKNQRFVDDEVLLWPSCLLAMSHLPALPDEAKPSCLRSPYLVPFKRNSSAWAAGRPGE